MAFYMRGGSGWVSNEVNSFRIIETLIAGESNFFLEKLEKISVSKMIRQIRKIKRIINY